MIEDIFAENLVDEPDDIERVIEDGGEIARDSGKSDGGSDEDDKKKDQDEKEKPKIRKKLGPRPVLNAQRLKGPRGIATMEEFFSGIKLNGQRGKEEQDLEVVLKRLELWTHRLYPRGQFDDCLKKIEKLGTNKIVRNYITRIRLGMEDEGGESDIIRDEPNSPPPAPSHEDPFDQLLSASFGPTVTSGSNTEMTTEQRERMLRNRLIAEEKRAARIKKAQELKERFKAQQAANSQSVNGGEFNNEQQRSEKQEQGVESNEGPVQMEVDDNPDKTIANVSIDQTAGEKTLTYETDEVSKERGVPEKENERSDTSISLTNFEDSASSFKERNNYVSPSQNVQEMLIDDIDPQISSSQDKCKNSSKENKSQTNGMRQNDMMRTEEMDTSEVSSSKESLTTVYHLLSKEETQPNDEESFVTRSIKVTEKVFVNEQEEKREELDCFGKENENPNNSH